MAASAAAGIAAALTFAVISVLLLAIGFSTDQWLVFNVNRTQLLQDPTISKLAAAVTNLNFFSRTRGLFRECYGSDVDLKLLPSDTVLMNKLSKCTLVEYLGPGSNYSAVSSLVWTRSQLMRTEVAAFCLSAVFTIAAISTGASACWRERCMRPFTQLCKAAGIVLFVSAFCNALGMAFFHGCDYLERKLITDSSFPYFFENDWPDPLVNATQMWLGFSYILCWISVFFECLSAIVLFVIGWTAAQAGKRDDDSILNQAAFDGGSAALGSSAGLVTLRVDDADGDRLDGARRPASAAGGGERGAAAAPYHIPRAGLGLARQPYYGAAS